MSWIDCLTLEVHFRKICCKQVGLWDWHSAIYMQVCVQISWYITAYFLFIYFLPLSFTSQVAVCFQEALCISIVWFALGWFFNSTNIKSLATKRTEFSDKSQRSVLPNFDLITTTYNHFVITTCPKRFHFGCVWRELKSMEIYLVVISVCLKGSFYPALLIVSKIEMHDAVGSVQQNGEQLITIFTLAYQTLQVFIQLTNSIGINLLLL